MRHGDIRHIHICSMQLLPVNGNWCSVVEWLLLLLHCGFEGRRCAGAKGRASRRRPVPTWIRLIENEETKPSFPG